MTRADRRLRPALTGRRGFVVAASFGGVSLYGLWAALGAAPFAPFGGHGDHDEPAGDHGGHGAAHGPSVEEFERLADDFVARHRQPDGSVRVGPGDRLGADPAPTPAADRGDHGAHGASAAAPSGGGHGEHAGHGDPPPGGDRDAHAGHDAAPATDRERAPGAPAEVYLLARQWSFAPDTIRLVAGAPYRFRMMAVDASHGAAIQLGRGSRIIRLRRGALVEQDLTFSRRGEYLVYCTVYCGIGHDRMSGRIVVG